MNGFTARMLESDLSARLQPQPDAAFDAGRLTFEASDLDTAEYVDAPRGHGAALVRGAVPSHLCPQMINDVEGYFCWLANGERMQEALLYSQYGNIFFATAAEFGKQSLMDVLIHVTAPPIRDALYEYFQADRVSVFLGYSFIRRHWRTDTKSISPFHQDNVAVSVPAPMLTCWVPLNRCGVRAPGPEVAGARLEAVLPVTDAPLTNHAPMEIDASVVERHYGDRLWHPEFDAGDAMLFDSKCVHRTHVTPRNVGGPLQRRDPLCRHVARASRMGLGTGRTSRPHSPALTPASRTPRR
jgi:hypothetical protein